ncbi:MAG: hypothetical protein EP330_29125 [Deltaproteobacteria bacterium]|nr:MAG: hypothetical protein EP330_29125 [Deltaproteobacteria bacterium]
MSLSRTLLALALVATSLPAYAAEVDFEGFYRARGRLFNSLSLNRTEDSAEGVQSWVQHRVWLRPRILIDEHTAVFVDFRALDGVTWGDSPLTRPDVTGATAVADLDDGVATATTADGGATPANFTLWRAWGEAHFGNAHFKVGRMPLHWGAGIWQNDGLGLDADFGDTADRAQFEYRFDDAVYASLAMDIHTEGYINHSDGVHAFSGIVGYLTETVDAGLYLQYRTAPSRDVQIFSVDAAASTELGPFSMDLEAIGQFGSGDFGAGLNDGKLTAMGGVLDLGLKANQLRFGAEGGFGTGDGNVDEKVTTFTFDRDFDVALMMFEQPMPRLQAAVPSSANGGVDYDEVLTGNAMSNVLYLRPTVGYTFREDLFADVSLIAARTAKLPDSEADRSGYGLEADARVKYNPTEHIELAGTAGVFFPGKFYKNADTTLDFSAPTFGAELNTRIKF